MNDKIIITSTPKSSGVAYLYQMYLKFEKIKKRKIILEENMCKNDIMIIDHAPLLIPPIILSKEETDKYIMRNKHFDEFFYDLREGKGSWDIKKEKEKRLLILKELNKNGKCI